MRSFILLFPIFLLCSCTSISRSPSATDKADPEIDQVIPLDSHQHNIPNSDGFLGAKPECIYDESDLIIWGRQRDAIIEKFGITETQFSEMTPIPIVGDAKPNCRPGFPSVNSFIDNEKLGHTLLISQSFTISEGSPHPTTYKWERSENVTAINNHVSEYSIQYPEQISGLCGLNYSWSQEKYRSEVQNCLKMKGLVGFKFYWVKGIDSNSPVANSNLEQFFALLKGKKRVVLWHLDLPNEKEIEKFAQPPKGALSVKKLFSKSKKIENIARFVLENPNITFVFAHGFYSTTLIESLFVHFSGQSPEVDNVYFELSATSSYMNESQLKKFSVVARNIGLQRFLFGTDGSKLTSAVTMYKNKFGFTPGEFNDVIYNNGHNFLENIVFPIKNELSTELHE